MDRLDVGVFLETTINGQASVLQSPQVAEQTTRPTWPDPAVRTLIVHDGSLGDVLLSLPCIMALGKPSAALDAVCRGDVGRLFRASGIVHGAFSPDSSAFSSWYAGRQDNACREMLGRYSRVFVFTLRRGSDLVRTIRRMVPDTQVIITVPPAGDRTHVAEFRLLQLPVALRNDGPVLLPVPPDLRRQAREVLERAGLDGQGRLIVLHPGSGGKHKCWPLERYFALAEQLAEAAGTFILFLSGPAEDSLVRRRIEGFVRARTCMAPVADADLTVVAGLLARGGLFVGNDSGISHLAAAIGAPVIALFGPTDPALWAPRGPNVQVIAATALNAISVADVLEAAAEYGARIVSA
jgi:heptosyltransferase III